MLTLSALQRRDLLRKMQTHILVIVSYGICAWVALRFGNFSNYTAPVFPAAGIALGVVLVRGYKMIPTIWLGSFLITLQISLSSEQASPSLALAAAIASIACLQAFIGARFIHQTIGFPHPLDTASSIIKFLLAGGPFSCLAGASLAIPALLYFKNISKDEVGFAWLNWWAGNSIGIVLFTPIVLSFFGRPEADWRRRRLAIVVPLAIALSLLSGAFSQLQTWEKQRIETSFRKDAEYVFNRIDQRLEAQLRTVESFRQLFTTFPLTSEAEFSFFAKNWLTSNNDIYVVGWAPRVLDKDRLNFEANMRVRLGSNFQILDRDINGRIFSARPAQEYYPIIYVEPLSANVVAKGLNPLSLPASAEAIGHSIKTGRVAASETLNLVQRKNMAAVVLYNTVFGASETSAGIRRFPRGIVYVGFLLRPMFADLLTQAPLPKGFHVCIEDITPSNSHRGTQTRAPIFSNTANCSKEYSRTSASLEFSLPFAGRQWQVLTYASSTYLHTMRDLTAWYALLIGLTAAGMLGAFLLLTTGRTLRIEELVAHRTAEFEMASRQLRAQKASLKRAQRLARLGSWEKDLESGKMIWSDELYRILGYGTERPPASAAALLQHIHPEDRETCSAYLEDLSTTYLDVAFDCRVLPVGGGELQAHFEIETLVERKNGLRRIIGTVQDVTEARKAEAHIHYLAYYDPLTDLPNRSLIRANAKVALASAKRRNQKLALLFMDLDRFKTINDTLGHPIGDLLLKTAAKRITDTLRGEDIVSRIGGDEFVVLLHEIDSEDKITRVARKLVEVLATPMQIENNELSVSTSIGIAIYPDDGEDFDTLVKHADTAMYSAKEAGRNTYQFFTHDMKTRAMERLIIESSLRKAIERNELVLYYQPQVTQHTREVLSAEALVRWRHPEHGLVLPGHFIPIAEEAGLINPIGDWILYQACLQQIAWRGTALESVVISINISALQFKHGGLFERIEQIVLETGANPKLLALELTESSLMSPSTDTLHQLEQLRAFGLTLALDDFGTGYSSLSYLKRLPLDQLKLDRSFVLDIPGDLEDAAIATATLSLARDLGLEVVAEGVETEAQRRFLHQRGCHIMQGYLFSPPVPAEDFPKIVEEIQSGNGH